MVPQFLILRQILILMVEYWCNEYNSLGILTGVFYKRFFHIKLKACTEIFLFWRDDLPNYLWRGQVGSLYKPILSLSPQIDLTIFPGRYPGYFPVPLTISNINICPIVTQLYIKRENWS